MMDLWIKAAFFESCVDLSVIVQIAICAACVQKSLKLLQKWITVHNTHESLVLLFPFYANKTWSQKVKWLSQGYLVSRNQNWK